MVPIVDPVPRILNVVLVVVALGSAAAAMSIARNCDAPDQAQALMLLVFPPVSRLNMGSAAWLSLARSASTARYVGSILLGSLAALGTWFVVLVI